MKVKKLVARKIKDTRGEDTIEVKLITGDGEFIASAPNGKSRGEFEADVWKKSLDGDIKEINKYFIEDINFREFSDLKLIEDAFSDRVGGNTLIALEYAFLKALAAKEDKEVWEIIAGKSKPKKMPYLIGNIIGGGAHSDWKSTTFQELQIIPMTDIKTSIIILKSGWENAKKIISNINPSFKKNPKMNDENAWNAEIDNKSAIEVLEDVKENLIDEFGVKIHLGVDVAASEFFKGKNYVYSMEKNKLSVEEQIKYMQKLSNDFYYIEDPLEQNDFSGFSEILKKSKSLIVGDDLTVTNPDRLLIAIKKKSINGIIIKPNQIGSLLKVQEIVKICKKNNIKMIFSHRSGETSENIISDIAFGFGADFVKFGALGPGRKEKLERLKEIEEGL